MKENLTIYLISGKARHGKTTLANMIKDYYSSIDRVSVVTSYSKYVKMYAEEITGWNGDEEDKPRTLLQNLGNEVIREKLGMANYFIRRLDEDMDVYNLFVNAVMIDDVRMPLEMDYFKAKYPGKVITMRIDRPGYVSELSEEQKSHVTEVGLDNYTDYDYTILNDGTLYDLQMKIESILEGIEV